MSFVEQHKMVEELREHLNGMKGRDAYDFEMLLKRDKDDETLDSLAMKRLKELYVTYVERFRKRPPW